MRKRNRAFSRLVTLVMRSPLCEENLRLLYQKLPLRGRSIGGTTGHSPGTAAQAGSGTVETAGLRTRAGIGRTASPLAIPRAARERTMRTRLRRPAQVEDYDRSLRLTPSYAAAGSLVSRIKDSSPHSRAGHPGWRRCSSLTYHLYARSSRLASRAPRSRLRQRISDPGH